ncbi:sigma-E processing peptidase SpoIIGA [Tepidibacter formicigenes]|jgi:stage II sporulation protein GA (sporulation sigma-E factor processing peptidase)|uniref:Sporulation sigma-E factor-processing peptidase n=1 Tax=Tepidibacter formicigenes DSM 15518 TaxID=1123349 RepID=A0A1M6KCP6_9FIRM|nr:sigma-E processing peptidase SpoIIGA [Tepidibacter formicigenes]SHJ56736.1 stage II sporulation protein GA (sporulation sigma-E factor processing peptidase) [Tepidibacter formicigenes DSM 15518]
MKIYAEYYFLQNLLLDYLIIQTTAKILNCYLSRYKALFGALLGAIYSMFYFIPKLIFLYSIIFKIIFIFIIIGISFNYTNLKQYFKILITFYLVNIFLAGSGFFIVYCTGIDYTIVSLVIIGGLFIIFNSKFLSVFYKYLRSLNIFKEMQKDVLVKIEENILNFRALMDTGNLLKDPITKDPVMIVDVKKLEKILPKELVYIDYSIMDFKKIDYLLSKLSIEISNRFRVIPYKVVGNEKGLILGIKADYIEVEGNKKNNIILGLSNFSQKDEYNAIINPSVL